jgi:23S rRNA (adenine2503-C2)-methyltransferase
VESASKTDRRSARRAAEAGRRSDFGDIKSLLLSELQEQLRNLGEPSYRAGQIVDWLYKKRVDTLDKMTNLPRPLRSRLSE